MERDAELLQVVLALQPPRRFPRRLHGRQQQRDQDPDDRNDNEQFNQVEPAETASAKLCRKPLRCIFTMRSLQSTE